MGLALLLVIWAITFASSYFFIAKTWWMPALAASSRAPIDTQFTYTYIAMGVVFVAAQLGLGLFAWKYRDRSGSQAAYSHGNTRLEVVWTAATAVLFLGLAFGGARIWAAERFQPAKPGALPVEATGMQFQWYFRYAGPDGKYGKTDYTTIDPSAGGEAALGMLLDDPAGADDVVVNTLMLPVGREVDVTLHAQDVIHSLFIPAMRVKQDAVPGLRMRVHFTPDKIGDYEIACAELCGLGHYRMRAGVRVVSEADFAKWMAEREAEKQQ